MKILSKREANREVVASLFKPVGTLSLTEKRRFDTGKYQRTVIGHDVSAHMASKLKLVWVEARHDRDGPYYALFCV